MGAVKLCYHKIAKRPYYAEATGIHLYSVEELAYYLYENLYLIDERMIGEKLYSWLGKELGMKTLAERLKTEADAGSHVYHQVMTILQASDYYSETELAGLSEKIREISGMQTQERMKCRADELMQNGNYWAAVTEYERILSIRQNSRLPVEFYAKVWNNLAGCYGRLFLFDKAAGCFETAYQFQKLDDYRKRACYARMLADYGKETEKTLEAGASETFLRQAENKIRELEQRNREAMGQTTPERFLKAEERKYGRISCIS